MKDQIYASDPELSSLLQTWSLAAPLPARFQEHVWQRVAQSRAAAVNPWTAWRNWLAQTFARPAMAFSYVAVLLLAGLAIGFWQGRLNSERTSAELGARYVQLMSSYESAR